MSTLVDNKAIAAVEEEAGLRLRRVIASLA